MADINLQCGQCEATFQVSEYVDAKVIPCPKCGNEIAIPRGGAEYARARLKLRTKEELPPPKTSRDNPETPTRKNPAKREKPRLKTEPTAGKPSPLSKPALEKKKGRKKRKRRNSATSITALTSATAALGPDDRKINKNLVKERRPRPIWEWLTFLVIAGSGLYLMWKIHGGETQLGRIYYPARMVIIPVIYAWVVFSAFKESYLPGIFAMFVPPYTFYFGVSRTDYRVLRGAMAALILCLIVELRFIPEHSFMSKVDHAINQFVGKGRGAIEAAQ